MCIRDSTNIEVDSSSEDIQISIANIGTEDIDSSVDGNLYIYFNEQANPSSVQSGIGNPAWTYSFSTWSDQSFRTADSTGNTIQVITPQNLSAGDSDSNPIGSIYAYIDYGDQISETDETNNDYYFRTTDLINYHGIDDGPTGGAVSTSITPSTTYPNAKTAETQFLSYLSSQSLTPQVIDFEESQGWGYGNFAGTDGDYENSHVDPSVSSLVSAPYSQSGNGNPDQNATGSIAYLGDTTLAESQVRFDLIKKP